MKTSLNRLLPMASGMIALVGCAAAPTSHATAVDSGAPAATAPAVKAHEPVAAPAATPAVAPAVAPAVEAKAAPALAKVDRYTVVKGDTLAKIAARPEVYGDASLWPLLYQSNFTQVRPGGLIFPGQVLTVNRTCSHADAKALKTKARSLAQHQPMLRVVPSKPVAKTASADAAASTAKAEEKPAAATPAAAEQAAAPAQTATAATVATPGVKTKAKLASSAAYLDAARRAFEAGDITWTLYYYNAYLDKHPKDANAWGELGNVYISQGMMLESAQCYYNAANLLIDQGKTARALAVLPAIQAGSQELADSVYWRLTSVNQ